MDIEKAFDSLDHNFLISTLEKYGLGQSFILWFKILRVPLMVVKLKITLCSVEVPVKVTQFQHFYLFSR